MSARQNADKSLALFLMSLVIRSQLTRKQRRQLPSLAWLFLRELEKAFPHRPFRAAIEPVQNLGQINDQLVVRLASPHPQVPELWRKKGLPGEEAERLTVEKTVQFIREVVQDRAVVAVKPDGASGVYLPPFTETLRRVDRDTAAFYVWSGPWDNAASGRTGEN